MNESSRKLKHLALVALGEDRLGIVRALSELINNEDGNISDSRMSVLGGHFAISMLLAAPWNKLARIEAQLPEIEKRFGIRIMVTHTDPKISQPTMIPYSVEVTAIDHPGIVYSLASFFYARNINIEAMETFSYPSIHSGATLFSLEMVINVDAFTSIAELRDDFLDFCDELNLDAHIDPYKI
jgi:glycine cleavage system transcriptional repressor